MINKLNNKTGRNDNCPCGSGRKYKKCCLKEKNDSLIDIEWRRLCQWEKEIVDQHLIPYTNKQLSSETITQILQEVVPEDLSEDVDRDLLFTNFFIPWLLFSWTPSSDQKPIAQQYVSKKLHDDHLACIEAICATHYSFYQVKDVVPEKLMVVEDLLLGGEYHVKEFNGTRFVKPGDIVFTRILTFKEQTIFIGMAPLIVPIQYAHELASLREDFMKEGALNATLLKTKYEKNMINSFFAIVQKEFNAPISADL